MFQSLDVFVLSFLFIVVEPQQGQDLKPRNLSLLWFSGFQPQLSWEPPLHSMQGCTYEGSWRTSVRERTHIFPTSPWQSYVIMDGGFVQFDVRTKCNGTESDWVSYSVTDKELVSNLQCYVHAHKQTHCSWVPASQATDLRFFYRLLNEGFTESTNHKLFADHIKDSIQECPKYKYTNNVRTGCDLEAGISHSIDILFNGTLNNTSVRNTFKKFLWNDVRPPPLKVTVTKNKGKFNISWTRPDVKVPWKFIINYTECQDTKIKTAGNKDTSLELIVLPQCPYCIAVKAEKETGGGQTPWNEPKCFAADKDSQAYVYAAIIFPLMFAALAVLAFVCCRKYKENIFPKVPKPRDLISDISDNNNKCNVRNLYVPAEEEENCNITLVVDPQINNKLVAAT